MMLQSLIYHSTLVFVLMHFDEVQGALYHISPSPNDSCSVDLDHCFSLSHLAANSSIYLTSNTTLLFKPGNHRLELEFLVVNISAILVHLNFDASKYAKIHCELLGRFHFHNVSWIHFSGMEFVGCTSMFSSVDHLIIEDTIFTGLEENGTALFLRECTTNITDSYFTFNTDGSYENHLIKHVKVGGAIIATSSNLTVIETIFEGNSADVGGAIYAEQNSNIVITSSTFINNTSHMTCIINGVPCFGGGAVHLSNSMMTVDCCLFTNNSAMGDGGVFEFHGSKVNINQSQH